MPLHQNHIDALLELFGTVINSNSKPDMDDFKLWVDGNTENFTTYSREMLQAVRYSKFSKNQPDYQFAAELAARYSVLTYYHLLKDNFPKVAQEDFRSALALLIKIKDKESGFIDTSNIIEELPDDLNIEQLRQETIEIHDMMKDLTKALNASYKGDDTQIKSFCSKPEHQKLLKLSSLAILNKENELARPLIIKRFDMLREVITGEAQRNKDNGIHDNPYLKTHYMDGRKELYTLLGNFEYTYDKKEAYTFIADLVEYAAFALKTLKNITDHIRDKAPDISFNLIKDYYTVSDLRRRLGGELPQELSEELKAKLTEAEENDPKTTVRGILTDEVIKENLVPLMSEYFDANIESGLFSSRKKEEPTPSLLEDATASPGCCLPLSFLFWKNN